jgi:hypothetical protein
VYYPYWTGWAGLALTPEWYALTLAAAAASAALAWFLPTLAALLALAALVGAGGAFFVTGQAALDGARREGTRWARARQALLSLCLHLIQPFYRAVGRLSGARKFPAPASESAASTPLRGYWAPWIDRVAFLDKLAYTLRRMNLEVASGTGWERWDLHVSGVPFVEAYLTTAVHEQTVLRCRLAFRATPWTWLGLAAVLVSVAMDLRDPAAALAVNLGLALLALLALARQRHALGAAIAHAVARAAEDAGMYPLGREPGTRPAGAASLSNGHVSGEESA